jgi:hypothetical protein
MGPELEGDEDFDIEAEVMAEAGHRSEGGEAVNARIGRLHGDDAAAGRDQLLPKGLPLVETDPNRGAGERVSLRQVAIVQMDQPQVRHGLACKIRTSLKPRDNRLFGH